ncbi:replication-relaxation family protein [Streptomyces amakusaensis]|uniref:Replication-relaxation family protein n=1 Tax=Streptomyces amakusaensis TaxID=67271 RepID=A0ABW0AUU3_9ACTN
MLTLARLRLATPLQLKTLLLPHQKSTDNMRLALRNLLGESPSLAGRAHRAQQSYWYCTPAGLAEAAASGELAPTAGRTTGKRIAASKTGLREHALALVDTVIAFHQAEAADHMDWAVESSHPTPAGTLVPDGVVLLADGSGRSGSAMAPVHGSLPACPADCCRARNPARMSVAAARLAS